MYKLNIKRILDLIISIIILLVSSPIFVIVFFILLIQNKANVVFFQNRPGLREKSFKIIKFKTMTDEKDENGKLLPDVHRITRVGSIIRKLSLDELPQLINVIKGDMSLVGPRPLLFKYMKLYSDEQLRRHSVRPGLTGWAQVNGRNSISWAKKFELDIFYVDNISFLLDLKILWFTFLKVIKKEGVNQTDDRPMLPFDGTN